MADEKSPSELKAEALEAMELLGAAINELVEIAGSLPDAQTKTTQLREISRTIQQLENGKVPVPDELRRLRTSLLSELGPAEEAKEAIAGIAKPLDEMRRLLPGLVGPTTAYKPKRRSRRSRQPGTPNSTLGRPGSFAYKKPQELVFRGERYPVRNWQDVLSKVCSLVLSGRPEEAETAVLITGGKRPLFGRTPEGMTNPKRIEGTDLFVECNLSADGVVTKCRQILSYFGLGEHELTITTSDKDV